MQPVSFAVKLVSLALEAAYSVTWIGPVTSSLSPGSTSQLPI
jgi:hypothetical protein